MSLSSLEPRRCERSVQSESGKQPEVLEIRSLGTRVRRGVHTAWQDPIPATADGDQKDWRGYAD